jgi:phosphatidylserine/phosphatidylglycerophosphate/cardiolipin synthase-like enzyme
MNGSPNIPPIATYVLTDWLIMQALRRAAYRGVKIRIYLDGTKLAERAKTRSIRLIHSAIRDREHRRFF